MATILARITVHEGKEAAFESLAVTLHEASHRDETRLRAYGYWRGQEPRQYYTLLAFEDYLGFMEHQTSTHHEDAAPQLRDCIASISLEWVDPIPGASKLLPSHPQELPAEANELTVKYAKQFPVKRASWWRS